MNFLLKTKRIHILHLQNIPISLAQETLTVVNFLKNLNYF